MTTPIPKIRDELRLLADRIGGQEAIELRYWIGEMYRRTPISHAPRQPPVRVPRSVLLAYRRAHPDATCHQIAVAFGMPNGGRVTDTIRGVLK